MAHGLRPRLSIPRLLTVTVLGIVAGCPSDDGNDTGNESEESSNTGPPALPDCQANADQTACEGTESCAWQPDYGGCVVDCTLIEEQATCIDQMWCEWFEETCSFEPLA